jgi:membrane dipeptidase
MARAAKPLFTGEPGDGVVTTSTRTRLVNQVTEAQLRASNVGLVYGGLWPPFRLRPRRTALDEALHQLRQLDAFAAREPGFALVGTAAEARAAWARGRVAVLPQVEGGEGIERVEDVDALYAAGARCITLVHFVSTQLGGAAKGQLEKNLLLARPEGALEPRGLTPLGRAAVERMVALGIAIDVAHASDAMLADVLALTEARGVPVLVSHTGARALRNWERNLSDASARRVVAGGGLVGISLFEGQVEVDEGKGLGPAHQHGTCDDVVAHWKHLATVVPSEALVLGSDWNGFIVRPRPGGLCPDGLRNAGDLGALWAALVREGVPRDALDGMGERLLRFVEAVEAKADPAAQAEARARFPRVRDERSVLEGVP